MEKKSSTRFLLEQTETQRSRRLRNAKDGAVEVYLTRQHARVLKFIGQAAEDGWNPTFREIQEKCRYGTPTGARKAVLALADHGLVETNIRESRSTRLTVEGYKVFEGLRNNPIKRKEKA